MVPGRGTFDLEVVPLNDQGFKIVYGIDVTREVSLRRQLTQLDEREGRNYRLERDLVPCDLNELVRTVASEREPYTKVARIAVGLDLSHQLPKVKADAEAISKVIRGLLTNAEQAIHLARRRVGGIQIRTWQEKDSIRLSVCDNGCGISTRDIYGLSLSSILRDGSLARPMGIGIWAEIVKAHGGEMFCWSSYDSGSTYTMELPACGTESRGRPSAAAEIQRFAGRSILVVEEDIQVTELMFDVLVRNGASVDLAETNQQAALFLKARRYDVVICERNIAGLVKPAGFQRFVFVTEDAVDIQTRRFFSQAGVEFLRRPFHMNDLMSTIDLVLTQQQSYGS